MWGTQSLYMKLINEQRTLNSDSFLTKDKNDLPFTTWSKYSDFLQCSFLRLSSNTLKKGTLRDRAFALDYNCREGMAETGASRSHCMHTQEAGGGAGRGTSYKNSKLISSDVHPPARLYPWGLHNLPKQCPQLGRDWASEHKPGDVVHACNPSTCEVEAKEAKVQRHPLLPSKIQDSLDSSRWHL